MPRGRPKVYQTEQARKAARVKARAKFRNIAIDSDLVEQLSAVATTVRDTGREQQTALVRVAEGVSAQAGALANLQNNEKHLLQLQAALHQNLNALAGAGAFEQAVHSLTAAIHLLTTRTAPAATVQLQAAAVARPQPGKAA